MTDLTTFLQSGKDWALIPFGNIPGVSVQKMPAKGGYPERLGVVVNPVDETGNSTKRRGLYLRDISEVKTFLGIFEKVEDFEKLFVKVEEANPSKPAPSTEGMLML